MTDRIGPPGLARTGLIARRVQVFAGFTLLELMIVVAVIGVLAAIALPSYDAMMTKSRRKTATACLVEASGFMERFYTTHLRYDKTAANVAVALPALGCMTDLGTHYTFDLNPATTATTYRVRATPQGAQASKDTLCATLTLDQSGQKGESGTGAVADCW